MEKQESRFGKEMRRKGIIASVLKERGYENRHLITQASLLLYQIEHGKPPDKNSPIKSQEVAKIMDALIKVEDEVWKLYEDTYFNGDVKKFDYKKPEKKND